MKNLTIIIYTHNEEKNIESCLKSALNLTKNVIVVDIESQDNTKKIAKKFNLLVKNFPYSQYVEPAREYGINQAKTDWVLILDADERVTEKLKKEIEKLLKTNNLKETYFKIPRKNIFIKKWLKYGGWWPDYQIRLINKKYFKSWPKNIHSTPIIEGKMDYLKNPLFHYFHGDLNKMVEKTILFEEIEADLLFQAKKKVNTLIFFRKFFGELYRRLFKKLGFLDGTIGIIESFYQAFSKTITYLFLYEKKLKK